MTNLELSLGLNTKDAVKSAEELDKEIKKIFESRTGTESAAVNKVNLQMRELLDKSEEIRKSMAEMVDAKIPTKQYEEVNKELDKIDQSYQKIKKQRDEYAESVGAKDELEIAQRQHGLVAQMQELEKLGLAFNKKRKPTEQYKILSDESAELIKQYDTLVAMNKELETVGTSREKLIDQRDRMEESGTAFILGKETDAYKKLQAQLDINNDRRKQQLIYHDRILKTEHKEINALGVMKKAVGGLTTGVRRILSFGRKLFDTMRGLLRSTKSMSFSFGRLFRTLLRYGIGIRSIFAIFNKLRSAVLEGFNNLSESSERFRDSINNTKASILTLKNSLASLLEPIVNLALPSITAIADNLSEMIDQAARFTAAATGQKYYMRAVKQTGDAAEKATRQLSGLDNLNILQGKQMFEEVTIDEQTLQAFAEFKELLQDSSELGKKLGEFITDNLNKINWNKLKDDANGVALKITDLTNGLLEADGLGETFGKTVAELGNTITGFGKTLVENFNFKKAGEEFGKSVQTFIDTYNWDDLGETIGGFLQGAIQFAWSAAMQIDVDKLSDSIKTTVTKILDKLDEEVDGSTGWEKIGQTLAKISDLIVSIILNIPWADVIDGMITALKTAWDESPSVKGLVLGAITISSFKSVTFESGAAKAIASALSPVIAAGIVLALLDVPLKEITKALTGNEVGVKDIFSEMLKQMGDSVYQLFHPDEYKDPKTGEWKKSGTTKLYKWKSDGQWHDTPEPASKYTELPAGGISSAAGQPTKQEVNKAVAVYEEAGNLLGSALATGLGKGVTTTYAMEVKDTLTDTWKAIADDARKSLLIHSPSKVFAEIGEYIDLGLVQGLESEQLAVEKAMNSVLASTGISVPSITSGRLVPQSNAFSSAMNGTSSTATPILDALQKLVNQVSTSGQGTAVGTQEIVLNLDGREFMRAMVKQNREYKKQHGGASAFA